MIGSPSGFQNDRNHHEISLAPADKLIVERAQRLSDAMIHIGKQRTSGESPGRLARGVFAFRKESRRALNYIISKIADPVSVRAVARVRSQYRCWEKWSTSPGGKSWVGLCAGLALLR